MELSNKIKLALWWRKLTIKNSLGVNSMSLSIEGQTPKRFVIILPAHITETELAKRFIHSMKNNKQNRRLDPQLARESELYENPIPSRELILQVMEEHGVPVKKLDLIKILEIQDDEIIFFEKRIRAMERQGQVLINRKDVLCIAKKINLSSGRVMGHPDGYGFLIPDDEEMDDVFLSP